MNYTKLIIFTAICASTTANASSVSCPPTVKAGQQLNVSAEFTNSDCNEAVIIKNTVLSLIGSSGSSASATVGLQGPFVTPLSLSIPAATCGSVPNVPGYPQYGSHTGVIDEGTTQTLNLVVIKKVPAGMKGKLAVVSAGVLDDKNRLALAGECVVTVN
jgi:hypothetical protein